MTKGWKGSQYNASGNYRGTVRDDQYERAYDGYDRPGTATVYYPAIDKPQPCPSCGRVPSVFKLRYDTTVGCDNVGCRFSLRATSVYTWNESIALLKNLVPKKPVEKPRLEVRLEIGDDEKTVRAQVVKQTQIGYDFNEACRIKGVAIRLFSDKSPGFDDGTLNVRGDNKKGDDDIVTIGCTTKAEAIVLYDALYDAIRAYNDGDFNALLDFPDPKAVAKAAEIAKSDAKGDTKGEAKGASSNPEGTTSDTPTKMIAITDAKETKKGQ
jgi:hypothetical protein